MGDAKGDWVKWRAQRPAGVLALYEVANPSLSSDEKVLGMDSTIALGAWLEFLSGCSCRDCRCVEKNASRSLMRNLLTDTSTDELAHRLSLKTDFKLVSHDVC